MAKNLGLPLSGRVKKVDVIEIIYDYYQSTQHSSNPPTAMSPAEPIIIDHHDPEPEPLREILQMPMKSPANKGRSPVPSLKIAASISNSSPYAPKSTTKAGIPPSMTFSPDHLHELEKVRNQWHSYDSENP